MTYPRKWEEICNNETFRLKVPNGWLVLLHTKWTSTLKEGRVAITFFEDKNHEWVLEDPTK